MINTINTRIDTARALPIALNFRHGETVLISIALYNQGQPLKLNEEVAATLFYRTNDLADNQWYKSDDSVEIDNDGNFSIVNLLWTGNLDNGADFYQYAIQLTEGTNHSYAIHGSIALENSPGFVPNSISLPVKLLDFSSVQVANAPYYTKSEIDAAQDEINNTLNEHAKFLEDLRKDMTGGANESLKTHEENFNNPHNVKVEQLTKKSASAGLCGAAWNATNYYKQGEIRFYFDPTMYRRGIILVSITMPNFLPPIDGVDISGASVYFNGEGVLAEQGNHTGWIFRSTTTTNVNGLDLYVFASINVPDLIKRNTSSYVVWVGVGTTTNVSDYSHSAEAVTAGFDSNSSSYAFITSSGFTPSGIYKVLTEEMLRDEETGLAYTLKVNNGELHLVQYREESFEG